MNQKNDTNPPSAVGVLREVDLDKAVKLLCDLTGESSPTDDVRMDHLCDVARRIAALARAGSPFVMDPLPERDDSKPNSEQGLYRKFDVRRTDGSDEPGGKHHGCEYFVLDIRHDPAARPALAGYAAAIKATHPDLARDLIDRYDLATSAQPGDAGMVPVPREPDARMMSSGLHALTAGHVVGATTGDTLRAAWAAMLAAAPSQPESRSRMRRVAHEKGEPVPRFDGGFDRTASHSADSYVEFQPERPASGPVQADGREVDEAAALAEFTEYFVRNYPGPDTIIGNPHWHAPRIFRAAKHALAQQAQEKKDGS